MTREGFVHHFINIGVLTTSLVAKSIEWIYGGFTSGVRVRVSKERTVTDTKRL